MRCPSCGHDNRERARFCLSCGTALAPSCPACGHELPSGAQFCDSCGHRLSDGESPARTPTPAPAPALPTSFASGRYEVERFLGEGGKKRVYLARDRSLDRDVAVSVIKTEGLDEGGLIRVQREAQSMGRLGSHPHIVTVHDIGDEDRTPYIVQEFMEGGSLDDVLRQAEQHRLPLDQALPIAEGVCQALEHAHGRGIIHRDLKPGNIWLTREGSAKLGDFGLAVALDRSRLTQAGMMVGTATYMPPEQALGGEATARSDLYSLGCVLYEMVAGRPPFVADDSVAVISQHLNMQPVAPSWHNPHCPPALEALIVRLLAKDPADRPGSAAEVRQALTSAVAAPPVGEPAAAADARDPEYSPLYRRVFVGREQELSNLKSAFDSALSGQGGLAMVVGEPGIGKTTVCEQLATYVALRGGRTLVGHCYEEGSLALPYLPFVEAMRSYVLERDSDALREELGAGASEIARIVSEVRDRIEVELRPPAEPEEERYRLLHAVTGFLRSAASVQALCIVLEDLHDADHATLDLLTHLARNLSGARLLIVGTYRDVEVDRAHPLSSALVELRRCATFQRIPLRGLTADEVQRMLSGLVHQEVPWSLAEAIHRQTEGHPLFVQEVVRYGAEAGFITRKEGQWQATSQEPLTAFIPEGLRDVIGKRLSGLTDGCNLLLSVAAVIGREFALNTLRAVGNVPEEELFGGLEEATRLGILEERSQVGDVRYRFAHAFFRQTLYEEMIAPRRIRLHQQVARALEEAYAGRLQEHAAELAEHFSQSSEPADLGKAVTYGRMAAERAMSVFAYGEAVRLLEQTLQVQEILDPTDKAARFELLYALGEALLPAGQSRRVSGEVAPQALSMARELDDRERATRACYLAVWALAYYGSGRVFGTAEFGRWVDLYESYAEPEGRDYLIAIGAHSWIHWANGELTQTWEVRHRQMELARKLGDPEVLNLAAFNLMSVGYPPRLSEQRLALAEEFASAPRQGIPLNALSLLLLSCGWSLLGAGRRQRAMGPLGELEELASHTQEPYVLTCHVLAEQFLATFDGDLQRAVEVGDAFLSRADELGVPDFAALMTAYGAFQPLLYLGRADEALERTDEMESVPAQDAFRALALAHAGRREEARRELERILADEGIGPEEDDTDAGTLVLLLQTALLLEEAEAARLLAGRVESMDAWIVGDWTVGGVARYRGATAALLGDPGAARRRYETALRVAEEAGSRLEVALTRLELAELLLDEPEGRDEALAHLDVVIGEFQAMKAQPALERALRRKMDARGLSSADVRTSLDAVTAAVQRERPDVGSHAAPDGTVTLLFTDIEDSTALNERVGDQRWVEILRRHNALVRRQIQAHGGYEVKTEGDGFMVAFSSARRALHCAIAIQRTFADQNESAEEPIQARIGLHTGEAIREADDFFGRHVTLAARIAKQARGGEILVSSLLKELTDSAGDIEFDRGRDVELKGLSGSQRVFAVPWR